MRYDFNENKVYSATIDGEPIISFIIPVANQSDQYAVGIGRRVGIVQWVCRLIDGITFNARKNFLFCFIFIIILLGWCLKEGKTWSNLL